ncbi:hypothetical protein SUDANB96_06551 [Streptomyces sp. enrichment culture]
MPRFDQYTGHKDDISVDAGPVRPGMDLSTFATTIRADVERIMNIEFGVSEECTTPGNFLFWFENDDLSISLLVAEPEVEEEPFDNLWACIEPISRSTETATWELAEKVYRGLNSLGSYLLAAFDNGGALIEANFVPGEER